MIARWRRFSFTIPAIVAMGVERTDALATLFDSVVPDDRAAGVAFSRDTAPHDLAPDRIPANSCGFLRALRRRGSGADLRPHLRRHVRLVERPRNDRNQRRAPGARGIPGGANSPFHFSRTFYFAVVHHPPGDPDVWGAVDHDARGGRGDLAGEQRLVAFCVRGRQWRLLVHRGAVSVLDFLSLSALAGFFVAPGPRP